MELGPQGGGSEGEKVGLVSLFFWVLPQLMDGGIAFAGMRTYQ
jgi:hypothetical protein